MATTPERFVPKVHPATRPVEPEDPMTLHATAVFGDPEIMLQCVIQEYAWMGWDAEQILALFHDPFYPALHELLRMYGESAIRQRIAAVLGTMGVFRFEGTVHDEPEPASEEPELVELGVPAHWSSCPSQPPGRSSHA
jgi:hypothetical protein